MANSPVTVAAGAVVLRRDETGTREVLLVHRPKYDDWAYPKGKLDRGEDPAAAAVREVEEETGLRVRLGRLLPEQRYPLGKREKVVHYWTGRVVGSDDPSSYEANHEIDKVRWVEVGRARKKLTYDRDQELLDAALDARRRTEVVVVLRHAEARRRKLWVHDDRLRPLLVEGIERAQALAGALAAYGITRVITSSSTRCVQTTTPYAAGQGLPLEATHALSEEDASRAGIQALVEDALAAGARTVLCTHRPVLPWVMESLGIAPVKLPPGGMVVVHRRRGEVVAVDVHPGS